MKGCIQRNFFNFQLDCGFAFLKCAVLCKCWLNNNILFVINSSRNYHIKYDFYLVDVCSFRPKKIPTSLTWCFIAYRVSWHIWYALQACEKRTDGDDITNGTLIREAKASNVTDSGNACGCWLFIDGYICLAKIS